MSADPTPAGAGRTAAPMVSRLRARPDTLRLAPEGAPTIAVRVQSAEQWDALRVEVAPETPVLELKLLGIAELEGQREPHEEYVLKLNGFEVLDEGATVAASGARAGSTYLLAPRRRRPVR